MKKNAEGKIRSRKVSIVLMEYIVVLGCLLVAFVMISGKKIEQTNSYAKPEETSRYEVVEDEYLTRVRPLTEYSAFKEIAENSLNKIVTVYTNETKTEEVVDGVITSGMVLEAEEEGDVAVPTQNRTYIVRVIGDLTGNGDCNVTELTRIIRHIVGIERFEKRGEEISADFSGDDVINVVDITKCINYIVYGKMDPDEEEVKEPKIEVRKIGEEEERSKEGIDQKELNGYVTIRENGIYKVTIEDKAGNKVEIEINDLNTKYTVTFKNEDGSIISERNYDQGATVEVPQNPSKIEDNTYTYEFVGWNPQVEEIVTESKDYTATYRAIYKNYTVTFKDEDGTIYTTTEKKQM